MKKTQVYITPTTHWDREWVMALGQFQIRLVNLVDNLLPIIDSSVDYRFLLDGQAIALEDYLEIKPEKQAKITELLQSNQLIAGPWYVLADQFLENGESTIRNLLMGMRRIRELGGNPMRVGYIPDSFGSIATMPMILAGFNIPYATFGRGRPEWSTRIPHYEFNWEAPDGSKVLAASHGYSGGVFLSYMDIWTDIFQPASFHPDPEAVMKQFLAEAESQKARAASANLYFPVGIDHMEPRQSLIEIIQYINKNQEEYELHFAMPEDYLRAVGIEAEALGVYQGEFRGSAENPMDLIGTLSSYMHLKQQNDYSENLLQRVIEPLWTMVSSLTGAEYPKGHLLKMWKLLLANHPHDSICGCSIDQVHKDMQNRFEQIEHIGVYLIKDGLHQLLSQINTSSDNPEAVAITIVNPLGSSHSGPVKGLVRVPRRFKHKNYALIDAEGNAIPAKIVHIKDKNKDLESVYMTNEQLATVLSKNAAEDRADSDVFTVLEVDFLAEDIPELGYKTYWIQPSEMEGKISSSVSYTEQGMENEHLKVSFHADGTFDLVYKPTGYTYHNLNYFIDREEVGDLYDHHEFAVPEEFDSRSGSADWEMEEQTPSRVTFSASLNWKIPEEVAGNQRSSSQKKLPLQLFVSLHADSDRLEVAIELDNVCKDHCLRVAFDSGLNTQTVSAFDHFHVIERQTSDQKLEWRDEPFQQFVDASDGANGLCIAAHGLPAYQGITGDKGTALQLTLLRSAGSLGNAAGANHPNAGGQCQGNYRFEYAIIPHAGGWFDGECLHKSTQYRTPFLMEADLQHAGILPSTGSLLKIAAESNNQPFISCLKQAENGNGWIIRLWNSGGEEHVRLTSNFRLRSVNVTQLDESTCNPVQFEEKIRLSAFGLTTIQLGIGVV